MMVVEAFAPSNIALIKYMGKKESHSQQANQAINSSLSYTLNDLKTFVRLTALEVSDRDEWAPLQRSDLELIQLTLKTKDRYIAHFQFLKDHFDIKEAYLIESANNFPSDAGLASSASSFAALTLATYKLYRLQYPEKKLYANYELAELSRQGSGSSCRSFFSPWSIWTEKAVENLELPFSFLHHQVVIVESHKKEVSSSEAHKKVASSLLYQGRPERAEKRFFELIEALRKENWPLAFEIVWAEFWDMHVLFETSFPSFGYLQAGSLQVLLFAKKFWKQRGDGPLVTMDAGANVHLLYRPEQIELAHEIKEGLKKDFMVFSSQGLRP